MSTADAVQKCHCHSLKEFHACKYGCQPGDSVQYCRMVEQGQRTAGALANVMPFKNLQQNIATICIKAA